MCGKGNMIKPSRILHKHSEPILVMPWHIRTGVSLIWQWEPMIWLFAILRKRSHWILRMSLQWKGLISLLMALKGAISILSVLREVAGKHLCRYHNPLIALSAGQREKEQVRVLSKK